MANKVVENERINVIQEFNWNLDAILDELIKIRYENNAMQDRIEVLSASLREKE